MWNITSNKPGNPWETDVLKEDIEQGLHPCTFTGEFLAEEGSQFAEVILTQGLKQYARILYSFPLFAAPTNEWLQKNANNLMGYCAFEKGYPEKLLLVFVALKKGATIDVEDFPNSVGILSEVFKLLFNDISNEAYIDFAQNSKLKFGKSATEPLPLGNKLKSVLENLNQSIQDIVNAINTAATAPGDGGATFKANLIASLAPTTITLSQVSADIQQVLSNNVYTK
jgi:hypothetical protein